MSAGGRDRAKGASDGDQRLFGLGHAVINPACKSAGPPIWSAALGSGLRGCHPRPGRRLAERRRRPCPVHDRCDQWASAKPRSASLSHRLPASLGDARVSMPIRKRGCWIADDTPRRLPCRSSLLYLAGASPLFYRIAYLLVFFVSLTLIWQRLAGLETTNGRTIWTTSH